MLLWREEEVANLFNAIRGYVLALPNLVRVAVTDAGNKSLRRPILSYVTRCVWMLAALFVACGPANARPLHVRDSTPAAEAIVDGRNTQYVVRLDGWIDHAASRMDITQNGKVVEPLVPTQDSEPDVLAASAPVLAPGRYQLHWHARSIPDGDFSDGFIPFTVAP